MDTQTLLYLLAALLVVTGIAGIILPALPGLPLVYLGLLLAAWVDGFAHVHWGWMIPLGLLTVLSMAVDVWATALGAKRVGASRLATWGATLGALVGLFFSLAGVLVGPFLGALGGELLHRRNARLKDLGDATRIGVATWFGLLFGVALKLALGFGMVGLFVLLWFIP